jgi:hypothetical protein
MENNSSDFLIKNNSLSKINFGRNSNNFSFGISRTLLYFLFLKIYILIYLFINLIYGFKRQKKEIKIIISLMKKYLSNKQSIISTSNNNIESEIYLDKYETDIFTII